MTAEVVVAIVAIVALLVTLVGAQLAYMLRVERRLTTIETMMATKIATIEADVRRLMGEAA